MADPKDPVAKPQNWDKVVSVAYLRIQGHTQKAAAKAAGVGVRTIERWEDCSWWPRARAEAGERWLQGFRDATRGALMDGLTSGTQENARRAETARWAADRIIPELAPPKVRTSSTVFQWDLNELSEEELELIKDCEDEEQATKILTSFRRRRADLDAEPE